MALPFWRLSLLLFLGLAGRGTAVALSVSAVHQDGCSTNLYASDCLAADGCAWCCDAVFGSQCFTPPAVAGFELSVATVCPVGATLRHADKTCEDLCRGTGSNCEVCAEKAWCYYCKSSGTCVAPSDGCFGNSITRTCTDPPSETHTVAGWEVLAAVSVALLVAAVIPVVLYGGWRLGQRVRQAFRRWRARRSVREERHPLISPAEAPASATTAAGPPAAEPVPAPPDVTTATPQQGAAAALSTRPSTIFDDDNVCYLCLAARPSVTFLPCYHTCCCEACSNRLRPVHGAITCPFCRRTVEAMVSLPYLLQQVVSRSGTAEAVRVEAENRPAAADTAT